jgi:hypothetical protein
MNLKVIVKATSSAQLLPQAGSAAAANGKNDILKGENGPAKRSDSGKSLRPAPSTQQSERSPNVGTSIISTYVQEIHSLDA